MDLRKFMEQHLQSKADITIAATAVNRKDASGFGIMKIDANRRISEFLEKPAKDMNIDDWKIPVNTRGDLPPEKEYLASMGIYIFNAPVMEELLNNNTYTDFGKEIIPLAIKSKQINSYIFNGYWEDIGTIESFYNATLALTDINPPFNFYDEKGPIYTRMRNLPPSKLNEAELKNTMAAEGCVITRAKINHSVIGIRSVIESGSELDGVITMGSDFYESYFEKQEKIKKGIPLMGIGKNCKIAKTIIDKNSAIGNNCRINVDGNKYEDGDHGLFFVSDGIVVIRKGVIIPDGTVI